MVLPLVKVLVSGESAFVSLYWEEASLQLYQDNCEALVFIPKACLF